MPLTVVQAGVGGTGTTTGFNNFKNRIINGAMVIAQRGTTAVTTDGSFPVDRFILELSGTGSLSAQQVADAPAGFVNSIRYTVTTPDSSVTGNEYYQCTHFIEGFNISDFGWGTSNAQAVTLSFWVKASQTGTYSVTIANSTGTRMYPSTYTVNAANTWEYKTVSIPGTTAGTFATDNNQGCGIRWGFAYGSGLTGATPNTWGTFSSFANGFVTPSNNMMATNNATWQITGAQLEVSSTASGFDYRPYTTELQLCQRYFWQTPSNSNAGGVGFAIATGGSSFVRAQIPLPVRMRAVPTNVFNNINVFNSVTGVVTMTVTNSYSTVDMISVDGTTGGLTSPNGGSLLVYLASSSSYVSASAEL